MRMNMSISMSMSMRVSCIPHLAMCGSGQHGTEIIKLKLLSNKCVVLFFRCLFLSYHNVVRSLFKKREKKFFLRFYNRHSSLIVNPRSIYSDNFLLKCIDRVKCFAKLTQHR